MQSQENFIYLLLVLFFVCGVMQEIWNFLLSKTKLKKLIIDIPNNRSSHTIPTARGGGAIFFLFASFSFIILAMQKLLPWHISLLLCISSCFISLVGFIDDIKGLTAKKRFLSQILCILLNSFIFYMFFSSIYFEYSIFVIIIFWFIFSLSLINFYNFADGINGYISFQFIASTISIIIFSYQSLQIKSNFILTFSIISIPTLGGIIFFLRRNIIKRNIFLGDTGSTFLGFFLSTIFLLSSFYIFNEQKTNNLINHLTPFYILMTWIFFSHIIFLDCATMILAKLITKIPINKAHKLHIYQIISRKKGFTHFKTTILFFSLQLMLNLIFSFIAKNVNIFNFFSLIFLYLTILTIFLTKYHIKSLKNQIESIS
ncbi:hypothetical protein [Silvanigrella aquatica]|uniref:Uncharacterized protein n=1 Tax=Silvanigrella aquatica TaxID=1915309 RepID=A0A1L4D329_9BACT|nr:hypothetical protein AXG55_12060 [Silvanigrella aquatica]